MNFDNFQADSAGSIRVTGSTVYALPPGLGHKVADLEELSWGRYISARTMLGSAMEE